MNLRQSAWYLHCSILDYTPLQLFQEVWETRPVSETPNVFDASPLWIFSQITISGQRKNKFSILVQLPLNSKCQSQEDEILIIF